MKRPIAVTIVAVIYILAGSVGFIYHLREWSSLSHSHTEILWMSVVRLLAVVAGVFLLRGENWARALALVWMAFHVVIGAMHDLTSLLMHSMLLVIIMLALLTQKSEAYFSRKTVDG